MARDPDEDVYDMNDSFPRVPRDLLEALEERFPDRCPDLDLPDKKVWSRVGNVEVVRFLREMHNRLPTMKRT
jgi:hypothetical protein